MRYTFRKQFPQTPKTTPILPAWQLSSADSSKEEKTEVESASDVKTDSEKVNSEMVETSEESEAVKSEVNSELSSKESELSSKDSETVIHKPVSSTSVDSDFQNGVVVNASASGESVNDDKLSAAETDSNKEDT